MLESDKYIPFPIEEVNFDFQVLDVSEKTQGLVDVLLVATRKENVHTRVHAFEMAKLSVKVIDVESNLIQRVLGFLMEMDEKLALMETKPMSMFIDIGAFSIKQYVFEGERLIYVHDDEFGGRQLTDMAASHYGMTQQAFLSLMQNDQMPTDFNEEVFKPYLLTAATQVKRMLDYFFSVTHYSTIDQLYLIGGVSALPGLIDKIKEQVSFDTQLLNPFQYMDFANESQKELFMKQASVWVGISGLAMRQYINPGWLKL